MHLKFHMDTFFWNREFSALCDGYGLDGGVAARIFLDLLDRRNDVHTLHNFAKNNVAAIEPASGPLA